MKLYIEENEECVKLEHNVSVKIQSLKYILFPKSRYFFKILAGIQNRMANRIPFRKYKS